MRRKLAAGNWKMNGLSSELSELDAVGPKAEGDAEILICPPATLISQAVAQAGGIAIGGQDCHHAESGAHTGDVSAAMLANAGASHVILGHSERRADHAETDDMVAAKALAAWSNGLVTVICVGETLDDRETEKTLDVVGTQLSGSVPDGAAGATTVIAYEPVWAIGTGKVPTTEQIGEVHDFIRTRLEERFGADEGGAVRILYGGSVKPGNATEIFAVNNVDGALVGGASLKAADFGPIIDALNASAG